ncbi:hypothetical protein CRYUN_Cryun20dG0040400 [Craigia yunnanensis]
MAEKAKVDERVDLEDNYMQEDDYNVEEHLDEDGVDDGGDRIGEENDEEEYEGLKSGVDGKDQSSEVERSHIEMGHVEDEEKPLASVKALYVKNVPDNTSTQKLKEVFQRHGELTKVVMPPGKAGKRDFGFIHYAERSSASKYEIDADALFTACNQLGVN